MSTTGQLGRATFELFVKSVPSVARWHGFPPPMGVKRWDAQSASDWLINEFFPKKGHEVALKLWLEADNDASFEPVAPHREARVEPRRPLAPIAAPASPPAREHRG